MQIKISKALEGVIARTTFDTAKAKLDHSLKDSLMLQILREGGSMAYRMLAAHLKDWELYQISLRIERDIAAAQSEGANPEEFFRAVRRDAQTAFSGCQAYLDRTCDDGYSR